MTRSAGDTQERLLKAAKAILAEQGFGGLSIRAVASKAMLNQGLVSYHFGGKQAFVRRVGHELYEDFFNEFSLQVEGESDPLEALRKGLLRLARFIRDHRPFVRGLAKDLSNGRPEAMHFAMENAPRHGKILAGLLAQCAQQGKLRDLPLPLMMGTVMALLSLPTLMADHLMGAKHKKGWIKLDPKLVRESLLTDEALELRVELALKALKP